MRDGAGGCPGQVHGHGERVASQDVGDRNGRIQRCREELIPDLEISVEISQGVQQQYARAVVKLADKDVGLANCLVMDGVLGGIDRHSGLDTAIGTKWSS